MIMSSPDWGCSIILWKTNFGYLWVKMSKKAWCDTEFAGGVRTLSGLLILLLFIVSSCVPITKRALFPVEPPANFSLPGEAPGNDKWWLDFQDTTLDLLIDKALNNNFSLKSVRERIEQSQALARQAGASLVPGLDSQATASSTRNHNGNTSTDFFSLNLAASYELDLWGRLRRQSDAAVYEMKATEADFHTAAISLTAEVAITWYQLVEGRLQLLLLTKQHETNRTVLELISSQFRAGKVGIADVLQQRQLVESNIGDLAGLRADIRVIENQLAILLGVPPATSELLSLLQTIETSRRSALPSLPALPETGIPLEVLSKRPDIAASHQRLLAADNRVAAAIADRLPRLSISADLTTSGDRSADLFNNWFTSLGANLFGPLFDGGRRKAEVKKNESLAKQQFYNHGQAIIEAIGEVENSLVRENEQRVILSSLETQLRYAAETIEHVATRYRQGAVDYQRVLLALLSHQGLQRNLLASRRQLINFRIALYRAISGPLPLPGTDPTSPNMTTQRQQ